MNNNIYKLLRTLETDPSKKNYWSTYDKIQKIEKENGNIPKDKKLSIALLSNFTIDTFKIYLDIECRKSGLFPDIYIGNYNQYTQEILDLKGSLYQFKPEIISLILDGEILLQEICDNWSKLSEENIEEILNKEIEQLQKLVEIVINNSSATILIHNLSIPCYSPCGILDWYEKNGISNVFIKFNQGIADVVRNKRGVYIFDYEKFVSLHGKKNATDYKMWFLAKMKINEALLPSLAFEYMRYVKPLKGLNRKCLVLDLDNTLWGGIIGEDGFNGIKLGDDPPGNTYKEFQKSILTLWQRGIILAINSKNNAEDAIEVLNNHPEMVLRLHHFTSTQINWKDKATNMWEIAKEINIGLDSMVYFDDDPAERELIKRELPEVLTVDVPADSAYYKRALLDLNDFEVLSLSEEDRKRGEIYIQQKKREELKKKSLNLEEFYYSLKMKATFREVNSFAIPRVTQLINKTNQFNLTTRRYNETEIQKMCKNDEYLIYSLKMEDRYGDNGIVGVAIIKKNSECWLIDTFLLSCRVIGRTIETVFLNHIANEALSEGNYCLKGIYVPTQKNKLVKDFFIKHNFHLIDKEKDVTFWQYDIRKEKILFPAWIERI